MLVASELFVPIPPIEKATTAAGWVASTRSPTIVSSDR